MENQEFKLGELILLELLPKSKGEQKAKYRCFCGVEFITRVRSVQTGKTKSCGCYAKHNMETNIAKVKHGDSFADIYRVWQSMKQRCYTPTHKRFKDYGGRGITVCEEWLNNYDVFKSWAISSGYKKGLSLDRRRNDLGYSPDNCRWATAQEQARNRRINSTNTSGYKGVSIVRITKEITWRAAIRVNYKTIGLGSYKTKEEAALAYNKAALKYFGEDAILNEIIDPQPEEPRSF